MATYKSNTVGLLDDVVLSYDKTKTTGFGRVTEKTLSGQQALGAPLSKIIDVFTDTAVAPSIFCVSQNMRIFTISAIAAGLATVSMYTVDDVTLQHTYVGKVVLTFPSLAATTHTIRAMKVIDDGVSGWKIFVATTATVLINSGLFMANNLSLSDFSPVGFPTLPMATATDQKAVYFLQDPATKGVAHLNTAAAGLVIPTTSANPSINTKVYVHNGVSATHQYYVWDHALPTPQVDGTKTGVTATQAAPGVFTATAHGFANNDPVIFTAGTMPTGINLNQVYFVGGTGGVNTANTFSVAATSGGAAIATTSTGTGITVMRAFGTCTNLFSFKTGNLPALAGTLLNNNSEEYDIPSHTTNAGQDCIFTSTSTNLYLGKITDLVASGTTWPTLVTSNLLGTGIDLTTPANAAATFSSHLDSAVFLTNTSVFVQKQLVNNVIKSVFGSLRNQYYELSSALTVDLGLASVATIDSRHGVLFVLGTTVGQRVILAVDLKADSMNDFSYITTPVQHTPSATLAGASFFEQIPSLTNNIKLKYKTAALESDAIFDSPTTGWTSLNADQDLSSFAINNYTQFRIEFVVNSGSGPVTPAQVTETIYTTLPNNLISDNWVGSVDNSTQNSASPAYTAFRLSEQYQTSVPTIHFRAHDEAGNLVVYANTSASPSLFEYSTDSGLTWLPLGAIPNTAGTEIRYKWATPPGVNVISSVRES